MGRQLGRPDYRGMIAVRLHTNIFQNGYHGLALGSLTQSSTLCPIQASGGSGGGSSLFS
jgi:hypothetical protein